MNKHFEDATYYLRRAGETAKKGVAEELEPVRDRFEELTGGEEEPEPNGLEGIKADLKALHERAEGEAKAAIEDAREQLETSRRSD